MVQVIHRRNRDSMRRRSKLRRRVRKVQDAELAAALRHGLGQGAFSVTDAVRALRMLEGLSQENFALRCRITRNVIKQVEASLTNPTLSTLEKIASTFGLRVAFVSERHPVRLFDAQAWSADRRRKRDAERIPAGPPALHGPDGSRGESGERAKLGYVLQSLG